MTYRLFALLAVLAVAGCSGSRPVSQAPAPRVQPPVTTAPVPAPVAVSAPPVDTTIQPGRFDTGKMWTFENPPLKYFQEEYGFTPSADWLKRVRLAALRLPNCSASFVSPGGLVMTNHHCARESATAVNRPGEDLVASGFYAAQPADERKVPDLHVDQLVEIRDVTREIVSAGAGAGGEEAQVAARDAKIEEVQARVGKETGLRCEATSLYHGGAYSLYCYRRYDDVRLVFTPEVAVAYFGGDPDNFTYPRYDLDVSFYRVYDADGRPVRSEAFLPWSRGGAREGDAVFVVGNPGSTSRLETVAQLEYKRDLQHPNTIGLLESRAKIYREYMKQNPAKKLEVENDYFSMTNALKAYGGELRGLKNPELFARKIAFERNFQKAIAAKPALQATYGPLWSEIADLRKQIAKLAPALNALNQGGLLRSKTFEVAINLLQYAGAAASGQVPDSALQEMRTEILNAKIDPQLDAMVVAAQLEEARQLLGAGDAWVSRALAGRTPADAGRAIVSGSAIPDSARRAGLLGSTSSIASGPDPALQLMRSALPRLQQVFQQYGQVTAQEEVRTGKLAKALFEVYGTSLAPDATFTLRIADGVVKGYEYNGTEAPWFTTFYGMFDRYHSFAGREEWALPARWKSPPAAFDLKTPLDLVSTNDIIGGNSGSPMVDREGRVVGLIFDGNIESLPGDFIYDAVANRAVSVHSEAIIEALRDLYQARRLVEEISATIR